MSAGHGTALAGRGIVITRPADEAQRLAQRVREAGGRPIVFPAIEILDPVELEPLYKLITRLDEFDIAIFVSPSAVSKAMSLITARRRLPPRLKCASVGRGSLHALQGFGVTDAVAPATRFDSEGLLALPLLQHVAGKRVVIFRGDGGRELLGDTLIARGARVEYAECYRRGKPAADPAPLLSAWARNEVAAAVFTSSEGLRNFCEVIGEPGLLLLRKTPVFVPHARIAEAARKLGLERIVETAAGDEAMAAALIDYFRAA